MKSLATILASCFLSLAAFASDEFSLERKIGQLIVVGFRGTDVSERSQVMQAIKAGKTGGVVLFDYDLATKSYNRNIKSKEQLRSLIHKLKSAATSPLFVCLDQEGGKVNRLKSRYGFPDFISADSLGKSPLAISYKQAELVSLAFSDVGANVNFAPVVDLNINPSNPIIGKIGRSFSLNADTVISRARAFVETFKKHGIVSSVKHFPGHGSSTTDSHTGFADVTKTWQEEELKPFVHFIQNKCDMVMVAHVVNKNTDDQYPASLSKKTIDGQLRTTLGYKGTVVTDDLQMAAISKFYSVDEAVVLSINAGADLLIFGDNTDKPTPSIAETAFQAVLRAVKNGTISEERINESFRRIQELKKRLPK